MPGENIENPFLLISNTLYYQHAQVLPLCIFLPLCNRRHNSLRALSINMLMGLYWVKLFTLSITGYTPSLTARLPLAARYSHRFQCSTRWIRIKDTHQLSVWNTRFHIVEIVFCLSRPYTIVIFLLGRSRLLTPQPPFPRRRHVSMHVANPISSMVARWQRVFTMI